MLFYDVEKKNNIIDSIYYRFHSVDNKIQGIVKISEKYLPSNHIFPEMRSLFNTKIVAKLHKMKFLFLKNI